MGIKIDGVSIPLGGPGVGVPKGGSSGQVLSKKTDGNYDTEWTTLPQATNEQLGLVKSSSGTDKVTVAEDGTMSVSQVSVAETALDASNAESANHALTCETASFAQQSVNNNLIPNGDMRRLVNQAEISWKSYMDGFGYVFENIYARNCELSWDNGTLKYHTNINTDGGSAIELGVEWGIGTTQTVTLSAIARIEAGTMDASFSVLLADVQPGLVSSTFHLNQQFQLLTFTFTVPANTKFLRLSMLWNLTKNDTLIHIRGIKLELGNHSTLGIIDSDNNVFLTDQLKPYSQALLDVQRYIYMPLPVVKLNEQWGYLCECMTSGGNEIYGTIHLPVTMYRTPDFIVNTITGLSLRNAQGSNLEITGISFLSYSQYGIQTKFTLQDGANLTSGFAGFVYCGYGIGPQSLIINAGIL